MSNKDRQRKKIMLAITKSNFGGAQRYVYDIASSLDKEKFDVSVIFGGEGVLSDKLNRLGVKKFSIPKLARDIKLKDEISVFFSLLKILKEEKPDVLHLNSSKIGGLGALAGRIMGIKKIIFTAHGFAFWEERPFWQKVIIYLLSYATVLLSHKTIVICENDRREITKLPLTSSRVVVIYNGVSPFILKEKDAARKEILGEQLEQHLSDIYLGSIAELHKNKNLLPAVEAVARYNNTNERKIIYLIFGSDGGERSLIEKSIRDNKMQDQILLLGFRENVTSLLSAFDIWLMTSKKEGLPYSILEAGFAGLPIIAPKIGGIPDIIENEKSGILIKNTDVSTILKSLEELVSNQDFANKLGQSLEKRVKEEFLLEKTLKETTNIYLR